MRAQSALLGRGRDKYHIVCTIPYMSSKVPIQHRIARRIGVGRINYLTVCYGNPS